MQIRLPSDLAAQSRAATASMSVDEFLWKAIGSLGALDSDDGRPTSDDSRDDRR